jgi:hypothetical protein
MSILDFSVVDLSPTNASFTSVTMLNVLGPVLSKAFFNSSSVILINFPNLGLAYTIYLVPLSNAANSKYLGLLLAANLWSLLATISCAFSKFLSAKACSTAACAVAFKLAVLAIDILATPAGLFSFLITIPI